MTHEGRVRAAGIVAVVGAAVWLGFGVAADSYGTFDDCGNKIASLAPIGVWIAMLVGGVVMAGGTTTWTVLRRLNANSARRTPAVLVWIGLTVSTIWFVALRVGLPSGCDYGRPLRRHDGSVDLPEVRHRVRWIVRFRERALARHWLRIARGEYASIAAFVELERSLDACGAPEHLLAGCRRAQVQEGIHAELAADLVERYSRIRPRFVHHLAATRPAGLVRLAVESWFDGCLNEGAAAAEAAVRRDEVRDDQTRLVLDVIARDEAQHAELAWSIIEWTLAIGDPSVKTALQEALDIPVDASRGISRPRWLSARTAAAFGWIDPALCARLQPGLVRAAHARLQVLLADHSPALCAVRARTPS